jgi:hypothetical protein
VVEYCGKCDERVVKDEETDELGLEGGDLRFFISNYGTSVLNGHAVVLFTDSQMAIGVPRGNV